MNQRQKYPPLCEVVTTRELKGVEHSGVVYGYIKLPEPDYQQKYNELLAWAKLAYAALEYDEHAADVTRTAPDEVKL